MEKIINEIDWKNYNYFEKERIPELEYRFGIVKKYVNKNFKYKLRGFDTGRICYIKEDDRFILELKRFFNENEYYVEVHKIVEKKIFKIKLMDYNYINKNWRVKI